MELSETAVNAFWAGVSPAAVDVVKAMDAVDIWAVDGSPEIESLMQRFASQVTVEGLSRAPDVAVLRFLGLIRSSRTLRWLASIGNDDARLLARWTECSLSVLQAPDQYDELDRALAMVFVSRIQAVRQQLLLASIFSPEALHKSSVLIARHRAAGVIP